MNSFIAALVFFTTSSAKLLERSCSTFLSVLKSVFDFPISTILLGIFFSFLLVESCLQIASFFTDKGIFAKDKGETCNGYRILCLGDSYTYGLGVKEEQAYPAHLETFLKERCANGSLRVVNAGRPGINTPILSDKFARMLHFYQPDLVLVMIGANDIWNYEGFVEKKEPIFHILNSI